MSKIEIENRHRAPPSLANTIILAPPPITAKQILELRLKHHLL